MKLTVYDPIFNHRLIQIHIGLAGLIRLRLSGSYVAYDKIVEIDSKGMWLTGYYLIRCQRCGSNYLSEFRVCGRANQSEYCPICNKEVNCEQTLTKFRRIENIRKKKPKVIILDNNPLSIARYLEEFGDKLKKNWKEC